MTFSTESLFDTLSMMTSDPVLVGLVLALATLLSEDGALITGSLLVGSGMMSGPLVILFLVLGIVLGDLGLYGLGAWARESRFVRKRLSPRRMRRLKRWLDGRESVVLFLSRFLPGTRLPTYLGFGYLRLSLTRFTVVMTAAGLTWVTAMVFFISEVQKLLSTLSGWFGFFGAIAVAFLMIVIVPNLVRRLSGAPDLRTPDEGPEA